MNGVRAVTRARFRWTIPADRRYTNHQASS